MEFKVDKYTKLELEKCPHVLVAGCTGSGKSYLMKSMLCDILRSDNRSEVYVVDPKCVDYQFVQTRRGWHGLGKEFYFDGLSKSENMEVKRGWSRNGIFLMTRDEIESGLVDRVLSSCVNSMMERYRYMMKKGMVMYDGSPIIVVIDELADLIYWDRDRDRPKEERGRIEKYLVKIATLGRAARVHLLMGTQRPDASVLSGQLRANIPTRICLRVNNDMERRIILGCGRRELESKCKKVGDSGDREGEIRMERILFYGGEYKELVRAL